MAGLLTVKNFCDRVRDFDIPEKPSHSRQKIAFRFGSALKPAVFGFGLKTVTALVPLTNAVLMHGTTQPYF